MTFPSNSFARYLACSLLFCVTSALAESRVTLIDAHSHHEVGYAAEFSCADVITTIERAGVRKILLTGRTNRSVLECYRAAPRQIIPFYSVYADESDKQHWMNRPELVEQAKSELRQAPFAGIGELHIFAPDAKSPVLRGLVELAELHRLPLLLHADVEVLDEVFSINPQARVLWAHMGTEPSVDLLESRLLRYNEGLYIDTSVRDNWLLGNLVVNGPKTNLLADDWRDFFIRHQDRVVVGIDTYSLNRWRRYDAVAQDVRQWLAQLPAQVAAKLAYENAERLFKN